MPNSILDFLQSMDFVAPAGYTVDYYITPDLGQLDQDISSAEKVSAIDAERDPATDTITIWKKDPTERVGGAPAVFETPVQTAELPKTPQTSATDPAVVEKVKTGAIVHNPSQFEDDNDDSDDTVSIQLTESIQRHAPGTLVVYKKRGNK